jgi:hypothetical protein
MLIENKYVAILAAIAFVAATWFTDGSLVAGFGAFGLIAGIGWVVRKIAR